MHEFSLNLSGLSILDFDKLGSLAWIAELMKHRTADEGVRYRKLAPLFIQKYGVDTSKADIIKGWRADSSYFSIAKKFVRGEIGINLLDKLLKLGNLGVQYCLKSPISFKKIQPTNKVIQVDQSVYLERYTLRDRSARNSMKSAIESDENDLSYTFNDLRLS